MNRSRGSRPCPRTPAQRGYVLVVVLVLLVVLTSAGVYGLQTVEGDIRAAASTVRTEVLAQAAEAGAAQRSSEIAQATMDAGAALDSSLQSGSWVSWPPPAAFTGAGVQNLASFQTNSRPIATVDTRPPPGRQIGSGGQTTVWQIDSYAARNTAGAVSGEYRVSVGVSLWSRGGTSYNN